MKTFSPITTLPQMIAVGSMKAEEGTTGRSPDGFLRIMVLRPCGCGREYRRQRRAHNPCDRHGSREHGRHEALELARQLEFPRRAPHSRWRAPLRAAHRIGHQPMAERPVGRRPGWTMDAAGVTAADLALARILWDWHSTHAQPGPADAALGLGSYDLRVADRCV